MSLFVPVRLYKLYVHFPARGGLFSLDQRVSDVHWFIPCLQIFDSKHLHSMYMRDMFQIIFYEILGCFQVDCSVSELNQ